MSEETPISKVTKAINFISSEYDAVKKENEQLQSRIHSITVDYFKENWKVKHLENRISGYKGVITKMKKELVYYK